MVEVRAAGSGAGAEYVEIEEAVREREVVVPRRREVKHLPVVSEHYTASSTTATTTSIREPSNGMKLRLTYVQITAKAAVYVYLQFKNHTKAVHRIEPSYMAANTVMNANLVGTNLEGDADEGLEYVTDAAADVSVMVVIEEVPSRVIGETEQE